MKKKKIKFDLNDILIEPEMTEIDSRSQITPYYRDNGFLPIFTAPMDTVVDKNNMQKYLDLKINVCLPRGEQKTHSINPNVFNSYSLDEFLKYFVNVDEFGRTINLSIKRFVLIDIANGHMKKLINAIKKAKKMYGDNLIIMAGNIANSEGYVELSEAGASFVRCGVGNGAGCFLDGTKVFCIDGYKNIEDVNDGDFVLTHTGDFKEVISKLRYASNDDLIEINGIKCTKDHKFLVINKKDVENINNKNYLDFSFWIEAEKIIEEEHFLLEIDINE